MSQRSKRATVCWRCPVCGSAHYYFKGDRSKRRCEFKAIHARAASPSPETDERA